MQARPAPSPPYPPRPEQFAAELPSDWEGGGNANAPANTQFRHELAEVTKPQAVQRNASYPLSHFQQFSIHTSNDSLTSGFPYNPRLRSLYIAPEQWTRFSNEVVNAAKLTFKEDAAAWTAGVGAGAASSPFLLVFSPVVGYYTGKSVHNKTLVKKVREKLSQEGELLNVFRQWNDGVFKERGLQAWLEPPVENGQVAVDLPPGASMRDIEKAAKIAARRFRIVIMPFDPRSQVVRHDSWSPVSSASGQSNWSPTPSTVSQFQGSQPPTPAPPYAGPMVQNQGGYFDKRPAPVPTAAAPPPNMVSQFQGSQPPTPAPPYAGPMAPPPNQVQELHDTSRPFLAELDGGNA